MKSDEVFLTSLLRMEVNVFLGVFDLVLIIPSLIAILMMSRIVNARLSLLMILWLHFIHFPFSSNSWRLTPLLTLPLPPWWPMLPLPCLLVLIWVFLLWVS